MIKTKERGIVLQYVDNYLKIIYTPSIKDKKEYVFRVWAPNADSVRLVSDFTSWDNGILMDRISDGGVWEVKISTNETLEGKFYKYKIWNKCR